MESMPILTLMTEETAPRFTDSFLDQAIVEDVVPDLVGRRRVVVRDFETDKLSVFWVLYDRETQLPFVLDPKTNLPYLLQNKAEDNYPQLYRMFRGKDHRFVVTEPRVQRLYRPVFNRLGEVEVEEITEAEAGFTREEVKRLL